jgi:hypothetical protein
MDRSRKKYSKRERIYIDNRIDAALKGFGVNPEDILSTVKDSERVPDVSFPDDTDLDNLTLEDLLLHFVGRKRMESSKAIPDDRFEIEKETKEYIVARVKEYLIKLDIKSRVFAHDCGDWIAWMSKKLLCKHVARLLSKVDERTARAILLDLYEHRKEWTFSSKPREMFA